MRIDVWSDLHCPFCHLGRRHLELALAQFPHADDIDVTWHSYQLDRTAPPVLEGSAVAQVARKYGVPVADMEAQHTQMAAAAGQVGLDFQWRDLVQGNSFDAHRVIHFARAKGREEPVTQALMTAWYSRGAALGDRGTLIELGSAAGLDASEIAQMLDSDDYGYEVRADEATAAEIGITSVPTFILGQKYAVVGAQPVETLLAAITQVWEERDIPPQARAEGCGGACACGSGGCEAE